MQKARGLGLVRISPEAGDRRPRARSECLAEPTAHRLITQPEERVNRYHRADAGGPRVASALCIQYDALADPGWHRWHRPGQRHEQPAAVAQRIEPFVEN